MSIADVAGALRAPPSERPYLRAGVVAVVVIAALVFGFAGLRVIHGGYPRADLGAILTGEIWREGGWLSHAVLHFVSLFPRGPGREIALSVIMAIAGGIGFGWLYYLLRTNYWSIPIAVTAVVALGLHTGLLYGITAESRYLPIYFVVAAMVPAIRHIEEVGDVQSAIGLSLLLPLLLLASPVTTLFILPLALAATLADPDGRSDPRAFVAMLLVATLPTVITIIGILGFLAQAGLDLSTAILPYVKLYSSWHIGDILGSVTALAVFAPVLVVPLLYCVWPSLPQRRSIFSALAVIVLPLALSVARVVLDTDMPGFVPPVTLLTAFICWAGIIRLPRTLQIFSVLLLVLSAISSWYFAGFAEQPRWAAALLYDVPGNIGQMWLR
ncbi:hypothetical protein [Devosia sp.]|uniref:hypothetical protein n=1 Tax=Devosia sp. TaxID=1871048 RepID=UPI003A8D1AFA